LLYIEPATYDECICGVAQRCGQGPVVVYDRTKVLGRLMRDGMGVGEAIEYIELNMLGTWVGPNTPLIMAPLDAYPIELQACAPAPLRLSEAKLDAVPATGNLIKETL
jgi:hypothetical protein